jgi:polyphosphate kinase
MAKLYEASQAGVTRSTSAASAACGRAPGLSENIKVVSVVGRF